MPDPTGTLNDGGIKFVRQTFTAKDADGTTTTYIVEEQSLDRGVETVKQKDANGVENKQAFMQTIPSGSIDIGFVDPTDNAPAPLQAISLLTLGSNVAVGFILTTVGEKQGASTRATCKCGIAVKQG